MVTDKDPAFAIVEGGALCGTGSAPFWSQLKVEACGRKGKCLQNEAHACSGCHAKGPVLLTLFSNVRKGCVAHVMA